jgi:triacylglycerol lipase
MTGQRNVLQDPPPSEGDLYFDHRIADVQLWPEAMAVIEMLLLRASPVFYGFAAPRGDGSGVVVIPGFLGTDVYLTEMYAWLLRMGYRPYFSGIGLNAECPNLLIRRYLTETVDRAREETGGKIHLIGHSLGGIIARSVAAQRPDDIASVITLASPFKGTVIHKQVLRAAEMVRTHILKHHGRGVLPDCYTGRCTCDFLSRLRRDLPESVMETAIYTRSDGIVDWHYCVTGKEGVDFEVPGTHIGLAFNPTVYGLIADRLAEARER